MDTQQVTEVSQVTEVTEVPQVPEVTEVPQVPIIQNPEFVDLANPIEKTVQILGFRVSVINVVLFTSARLAIYLNCKTGQTSYIDYKELVIEGAEYAAWKDDDSYIMQFVESKIPSFLQ
jgi:hypothetical protein